MLEQCIEYSDMKKKPIATALNKINPGCRDQVYLCWSSLLSGVLRKTSGVSQSLEATLGQGNAHCAQGEIIITM